MLGTLLGRSGKGPNRPSSANWARSLQVESLEDRTLLSVTTMLNGGILTVTADPAAANNNIRVSLDPTTNQLVVLSFQTPVARFDSASVSTIQLFGGPDANVLAIDPNVTQAAFIQGGGGQNTLRGGGGNTTILGGPDIDKILIGPGTTLVDGGAGINRIFGVKPTDTVIPEPGDQLCFALPIIVTPATPPATLTGAEVQTILLRASAADPGDNAIIAILDRGGRLLGVRVGTNVSPLITGNPEKLTFAIDGAMALARTGAFFGSAQAPLTSRTIQDISQTTMTQREIMSDPNILDPNSTLRGPGFVAPVGLKNHFPAGIQYTPQVDLFAIEHTNRDSIISPGANHIRQVVNVNGVEMPAPGSDDIQLAARFNIDPAFYNPAIPVNQRLAAPESYGFLTGLFPSGQGRGIGTLPGGIPIYKNGQVVGGIGVFYPGTTGFATEENSVLSETFDPRKPDLSFRAEAVAFEAVGGIIGNPQFRVPIVGGIPIPDNIGIVLPAPGRIDLVGITLDVFGPHGNEGPFLLKQEIQAMPPGDPNAGTFLRINTNGAAPLVAPAGVTSADPNYFANSTPVPEGWIVVPHDGVGVTAAEVEQIVAAGIQQANQTRAAIRLPLSSTTRMVFAVTDLQGNIVGLYRMPDATIFSIDVAVAKARNVTYYANPAQLQPLDMLPGVAPGTAITNRSIRYLSLPRFPEGIDGSQPGPFSILNDGGVLVPSESALTVGPPLPASAFQSVQGFDAFNPQSNFHDPFNIANQNGIVFFPGSAALFRNHSLLIGGFGVSGDGVDQDDVVTTAGATGFEVPLRIDQVFVKGIRVPYNKFDRNPEGL